MNKIFLSIFLVFQLFGNAEALPIVPGLHGYGVETTAGSGPNRIGGIIIHVTNLDDSGPGSLREACLYNFPRTVVFDVSGYIRLLSRIDVRNPWLTIAGQTAPSPGISVVDDGIIFATHDVLVQHIRIRVGDLTNSDPDNADALGANSQDGWALGDVYNIVFDHVSVSWAIDENVSITGTTGGVNKIHDITFSNSIISEGLMNSIHPKGAHSMGMLLGPAKNVALLNNYWAHNNDRHPRVGHGMRFILANSYIYDWGKGQTGIGGSANEPGAKISIVGNVYRRGPSTGPKDGSWPVRIFDNTSPTAEIFIEDNLTFETPQPDVNEPWDIVRMPLNRSKDEFRALQPPFPYPPGFTPMPSSEVVEYVLANAGARPADRDAVDKRVVADGRVGGGKIIDSQSEVGGWPVLQENVERAQVPSTNPWQKMPSGYNRLEEWLHAQAKLVEN